MAPRLGSGWVEVDGWKWMEVDMGKAWSWPRYSLYLLQSQGHWVESLSAGSLF